MSEECGVGRPSGLRTEQAPREWIALAVAERGSDYVVEPYRRGRPVALDPDWHRLTRRLQMLGQRKRRRARLPLPANDRGHRHSMSFSEDSLAYRLLAAGCVALASIALLTLIGAATIDPDALLALPG